MNNIVIDNEKIPIKYVSAEEINEISNKGFIDKDKEDGSLMGLCCSMTRTIYISNDIESPIVKKETILHEALHMLTSIHYGNVMHFDKTDYESVNCGITAIAKDIADIYIQIYQNEKYYDKQAFSYQRDMLENKREV